MCVDVSFHFSGMNAWECDTGSLGKCTLSFFLRNCQAIFWQVYPFYGPAAVCVCDLQPVASSVFFISAVLAGEWRYLAIAPTGVSRPANRVGHLFTARLPSVSPLPWHVFCPFCLSGVEF